MMNELQSQLTKVQQMIQTQEREMQTLLSPEEVAAALAPLRQKEQQLQAALAGGGAIAQAGSTALGQGAAQVGGNLQGVLITGDNNSVQYVIQQGGGKPDDATMQQAVADYLRWLTGWCGKLELRGIQHKGKKVLRLDLETVYVPLAAEVYQPDDPKQNKPDRLANEKRQAGPQTIPMNQLLQQGSLQQGSWLPGSRLILTGGPGCGKTTVLLHLAWAVAMAMGLNRPVLAQEKVGFPAGDKLPLPIFVPLSLYATHLRQKPADRTLAAFITHYLFERQTSFNLPADFFRHLLRGGRGVLLLLDGLDEVPDETERAQVRQAIEDLVRGREGVWAVVSCRTAAYHGRSALGEGFREVTVKPLDAAHITALVTQAYAHLYQEDPGQQSRKQQELLDGIQKMEAERQKRLGENAPRLIDSPLLVRMLLIVHYRERRLPEQRAELFMKATDAMLLPDYAPDENTASQIGAQVGGNWEVHRDMVQHLAFHMHQRGEQQGREVDEAEVRRVLNLVPAYVPLINDFIALTRLRGTVLEERLGIYRFIHLAFQEYLAARYLAEIVWSEGGVNGMAALLEEGPLLESWWREVALLAVGYLSVTSPQAAHSLLEHLIEDKPTLTPDMQLAVAEVAGVAWLEWQAQREELRLGLVNRLHTLTTQPTVMGRAGARWRVAAGQVLGRLGDPRSEVMTVDGMRFCYVPAGPFWMGSSDNDPMKRENEGVLRRVAVPYDYWLGQYPVTQAQFREFVAAGGYQQGRYWAEAKQLRYWQNGRFKGGYDNEFHETPVEFGEPFSLPNHPVVGVSWYECLAFSRWLTERWRKTGWLPADWLVRLPSEAEWEKAARGGLRLPPSPMVAEAGKWQTAVTLQNNANSQRRFPWGHTPQVDTFQTGICNSKTADSGSTSAVGLFPADCSPYGVWEMGGNVNEWTQSLYRDEPYQIGDGREKLDASNKGRSIRGGSWTDDEVWLRCAFRGWDLPYNWNPNLGFRLVASPSTSGL